MMYADSFLHQVTTQDLGYDACDELSPSLGRLSVQQAPHVCASLHAIAITSDSSLTGSQRFMIASFATISCCFPHEETRNHFHDDPLTRRPLHDHTMIATLFLWPRKTTRTGFKTTAFTVWYGITSWSLNETLFSDSVTVNFTNHQVFSELVTQNIASSQFYRLQFNNDHCLNMPPVSSISSIEYSHTVSSFSSSIRSNMSRLHAEFPQPDTYSMFSIQNVKPSHFECHSSHFFLMQCSMML